MPASVNADEIVMQRHRRSFMQIGGARPSNSLVFSGMNSQYFFVNSVKIPQLGSITPVYNPDPNVQGKYRLVDRSKVAPGLPTASIQMREAHGSIPIQLTQLSCPFTIYDVTGVCAQLSDFNASGTDYWEVFSNMVIMDKDLGPRTSPDKDDPAMDTLTVTLSDYYVIGSLPFTVKATTNLTAYVVTDVIFGNKEQCGDCGPSDTGTNRIYACCSGGAASKPQIVYSVDGGLTWAVSAIAVAANNDLAVALGIVGNNLVLAANPVAAAASFVYWSPINSLTGVPSSSWTKVTPSVFTTAAQLTDMFVLSPTEVLFSAKTGYIYETSDPTSASAYFVVDAGSVLATDYNRIHGDSQGNIVLVGNTNGVVKSINRGATFAATTTQPTGTWTALFVMDRYRFWVGSSTAGILSFTLNGGETWTTKSFTGDTVVNVTDIVFPTDEVGFVAYTISGGCKIATTMDGGERWTITAPRIQSLPAAVSYTRISTPFTSDSSINVNALIAGGTATGGTNGILALAIAPRM